MNTNLPEYIKKVALPLGSVTDGEDFSDLEPLKEILKNVRIVGLGESTHGTREFFQLKHRVTRFLVEQMGYMAFTIEAGVLPCMNIDEYAFMGKGDRAKALASQGYWTWDTEEVTDLIEWMRQHNLNCRRGEECRFIGYDIKPIPEACAAIRRIVKKALPEGYEKADGVLKSIEELPFPNTSDEPRTCDDIMWLWGWLAAQEMTICSAAGQPAFDLAMTSCRMVYQYMYGMVVNSGGLDGRDKGMAENIFHIMESLPDDAKIVVWAHNAHIAADDSWKSMGKRLKERYGDQYFPFALTFTRGTFQSRLIPQDDDGHKPFGDLQEFDAGEPREGFWEKDFMQVREGDWYIGLREARRLDEEALRWCSRRRQVFGAGGGYAPISENAAQDERLFQEYNLSTHFDGVFHIEKTTRARPTPTGMRKAGQASK